MPLPCNSPAQQRISDTPGQAQSQAASSASSMKPSVEPTCYCFTVLPTMQGVGAFSATSHTGQPTSGQRSPPDTATRALMGTDSGCSGRVASWWIRPTRSLGPSPSPMIPPAHTLMPALRTLCSVSRRSCRHRTNLKRRACTAGREANRLQGDTSLRSNQGADCFYELRDLALLTLGGRKARKCRVGWTSSSRNRLRLSSGAKRCGLAANLSPLNKASCRRMPAEQRKLKQQGQVADRDRGALLVSAVIAACQLQTDAGWLTCSYGSGMPRACVTPC